MIRLIRINNEEGIIQVVIEKSRIEDGDIEEA